MRPGPKPRALAERFWEKVRKTNGCWLWNGSVDRWGYGQIIVGLADLPPVYAARTRAIVQRAHRVAWFLSCGRWPSQSLLHTCDTPRCVNPVHLYEGTNRDNMRDKLVRKRQRIGDIRGELHPSHKLQQNQVAEIRALHATGGSYSTLAKRYGVSDSQIGRIVTGRGWPTRPSPFVGKLERSE